MMNHTLMSRSFISSPVFLIGLALVLSSCRGQTSEKPPIHPNLNMDYTVSFKPQEKNAFFADGRSMRPPVEGTVARGQSNLDTEYFEGKTASGSLVPNIPVEVTREMLERGKDRYEIFCTPCHGGSGAGDGLVISRGYVPPQTYHQDRLRDVEDGYIYDVIANGIRNMPAYRRQIPVEDRWAIVAYVRALQLSQNVGRDVVSQFMSESDLRNLDAGQNNVTSSTTDSTSQSPR
jgi:hypothetical protein